MNKLVLSSFALVALVASSACNKKSADPAAEANLSVTPTGVSLESSNGSVAVTGNGVEVKKSGDPASPAPAAQPKSVNVTSGGVKTKSGSGSVQVDKDSVKTKSGSSGIAVTKDSVTSGGTRVDSNSVSVPGVVNVDKNSASVPGVVSVGK